MAELYTPEEVGQAALEVALVTALFLIREHGDAEAAIEGLVETDIGVNDDELLNASAISAQAIRRAVDMGVMPR